MKVVVNNLRRVTVPEAYVTKNKQRIKQYGDTVYLNNGDEFELELVNYSSRKVLAKIEFNGISIGSSGIVLRPGERVFLERYLDISKKFLFETYNIDGSDNNAIKAIKDNGNVCVRFHEESIPAPWVSPTITWSTGTGQWTGDNLYNGTVTYSNDINSTPTFGADCIATAGPATFFSQTLDMPRSAKPTTNTKSKSIETGRVEQGSHSGQVFSYDHSSFNSWWTWERSWKILPNSRKPLTTEDLVVYCTNCGTKRKKQSHKFCPNCGNQF